MSSYYNLNISDTIKSLDTAQKGLSVQETEKRLEEHGVNELKESNTITPAIK